MNKYTGTKTVKALPMNRSDYNAYRGWRLPKDENGEDEGYLVVCTDGGDPNHPDSKGYISWLPKEHFDNVYCNIHEGISFGHALKLLKEGHKVSRKAWNGKGIFIELQVPDVNSKMPILYIFIDTTGLQTENEEAPKSRVPWLASQTDILAEDWVDVG